MEVYSSFFQIQPLSSIVCELHLSITLYRNGKLLQEPSEALSSSRQAFSSECKRPHNPQTNPLSPREPIAAPPWTAQSSSNTPLSIFLFFWKGEIVCDGRIMEIFFKCCVSSASPRRSADYFSFTSSLSDWKLFLQNTSADSLAAFLCPVCSGSKSFSQIKEKKQHVDTLGQSFAGSNTKKCIEKKVI